MKPEMKETKALNEKILNKLGIKIDQIDNFEGLSGLHFHTLFGSESVVPLRKTIEKIEAKLDDILHQLDWINIGGGYVFNDRETLLEFEKIVCGLSDRYDLTVFFEPGKGIIGDAGELITTVIDIFESDGKTIVVSSDKVVKPIAVRFGWSNTAQPNLFNMEGLPASPFKTDGWKRIIK